VGPEAVDRCIDSAEHLGAHPGELDEGSCAGVLGRGSLGDRDTRDARGDHIEDALDARVRPLQNAGQG
jgi:hypothetical protein